MEAAHSNGITAPASSETLGRNILQALRNHAEEAISGVEFDDFLIGGIHHQANFPTVRAIVSRANWRTVATSMVPISLPWEAFATDKRPNNTAETACLGRPLGAPGHSLASLRAIASSQFCVTAGTDPREEARAVRRKKAGV